MTVISICTLQNKQLQSIPSVELHLLATPSTSDIATTLVSPFLQIQVVYLIKYAVILH